MAFIKTQSQPPSGGVNRESSEGRGALPRHVPKPLQAGPCLASMADHRGRRGATLHTCVLLAKMLVISGRRQQTRGKDGVFMRTRRKDEFVLNS